MANTWAVHWSFQQLAMTEEQAEEQAEVLVRVARALRGIVFESVTRLPSVHVLFVVAVALLRCSRLDTRLLLRPVRSVRNPIFQAVVDVRYLHLFPAARKDLIDGISQLNCARIHVGSAESAWMRVLVDADGKPDPKCPIVRFTFYVNHEDDYFKLVNHVDRHCPVGAVNEQRVQSCAKLPNLPTLCEDVPADLRLLLARDYEHGQLGQEVTPPPSVSGSWTSVTRSVVHLVPSTNGIHQHQRVDARTRNLKGELAHLVAREFLRAVSHVVAGGGIHASMQQLAKLILAMSLQERAQVMISCQFLDNLEWGDCNAVSASHNFHELFDGAEHRMVPQLLLIADSWLRAAWLKELFTSDAEALSVLRAQCILDALWSVAKRAEAFARGSRSPELQALLAKLESTKKLQVDGTRGAADADDDELTRAIGAAHNAHAKQVAERDERARLRGLRNKIQLKSSATSDVDLDQTDADEVEADGVDHEFEGEDGEGRAASGGAGSGDATTQSGGMVTMNDTVQQHEIALDRWPDRVRDARSRPRELVRFHVLACNETVFADICLPSVYPSFGHPTVACTGQLYVRDTESFLCCLKAKLVDAAYRRVTNSVSELPVGLEFLLSTAA